MKFQLNEQAKDDTVRIAFLDIASKEITDSKTNIKCYRLTPDVLWVADTPIVIELYDGIVKRTQSRTELSSRDSLPNAVLYLAENLYSRFSMCYSLLY
ncbi:MAG: hypothetical protein LBU65_00390 [Planctomycetaceae bacterium]|nr:hypothetical protein [Planctomycetaceae bacterium]